ncbi:MAG: cobalamin-dependent protein [Clostridia bacterium]|nr:cobalamin-dependent protein [Clostridia bacterium]
MSDKRFDASRNRCITIETIPWENLSLTQLHTEQFVEIDWVLSGQGIHRIPNQTVPCKEGDVFVLSSQTPHGFEAENPEQGPTVFRILFDPKVFFSGEEATEDHPRFCYGVFCEDAAVSCATLNKETVERVEPTFRAIQRELEKERPDWKNAVGAHLSVLLITLSRYMNGAIRKASELSRKDRALISAALRIVKEEFSSDALTLESLAATLFISPAQLSRVFKNGMGRSFSDYLKELRMAHACRLLKETELPVEQILSECGLRDLQTFYRSFHHYAQMTPSQYRNRYGQRKAEESKEDQIEIFLKEISENLQRGKAKIVTEKIRQALDSGCDPSRILDEGLLAGMSIIGEKFKNNEAYVPEVLVAARAMNMGVSMLKPHLASDGAQAVGRVCIGTVQGDLHDIGKNLVKMMLEGKGLEVIDLGVDVPPEVFVQTVKEQNCQVICCSALLTTTLDVLEQVVQACTQAGIRDRVRIMIGGAPVNQELCDAIGADCYTSDAASAADAAVRLCKELL